MDILIIPNKSLFIRILNVLNLSRSLVMIPFQHKKFHISLRFKAVIIILIVNSILFITLIFYTISGHHKMVEDLAKDQLKRLGATIAPFLVDIVHQKDIESLQKQLLRIKNNSEIIYISVYGENGTILDKQIAEN